MTMADGDERRGALRSGVPGPAEQRSPAEILKMIEGSIAEMQRFMQAWHRALICGQAADRRALANQSHTRTLFGRWLREAPPDGLLDQPAVRELATNHAAVHDAAKVLAVRAGTGAPLKPVEYDALINQVNRFYDRANRIADAFRRLAAEIDPLTGLNNRQAMLKELNAEVNRGRRAGTVMCVALADIDHFKSVNDTHGHAAGDTVLASVAGRFQSNLRPYDTIYRYGGEEFLICLPEADPEAAKGVLERLRLALLAQPVALGDGRALDITASFGIAAIDYDAPLKTAIENADRALYAAKQGGRNRICLDHAEGAAAADGAGPG